MSAFELAAWFWLLGQRDTLDGWVSFQWSPHALGVRVHGSRCRSLLERGHVQRRRDPQLGPGWFYRIDPAAELDVTRSMAAHMASTAASSEASS